MLRQLFTRPTKRAIQAGGTVLLAGAMVCGSVPAYAIGSVKPHQATPIAQPNEPAVTCSDRADYEYESSGPSRKLVFEWAQCAGLITEYQKHVLFKNDSVVSRGQFVEYLYRLSGSPEVKILPAQSPYGDIKTDDPRFPVVMWARERGITWGWSDGNFHYDAPANDTTTVIMAYRLAGSPKVNLPDKNPPDAVYPWEERHHNLPYGSELHRAYVWLEFTGDGRTYLPSGVATVDDLWFNAWTFKATHTQAFEVLRLADIRGAF